MTARWRSWSTGQRLVAVVVGAIVAVNLVLVALDGVIGGGPSGPASSPTATAGHGMEAYAELLRSDGATVEVLRDELEADGLGSFDAVILADPVRLTRADADELTRFADAGGRLVLAGPATAEIVAGMTGIDVTIERSSPVERLEVSVPGGPAGSAGEIAGDDGARWRGIGGLLPIAGDGRAPVLVTGMVGEGRMVALATARPLQNHALARADNAALGLGLAGDSERVAFLDRTAPSGGSGLGAVPTAWKWTSAGVAIAAIAALWAAGTRFGPPEPVERELRPARREHVEAVAAGLRRAARRTENRSDRPTSESTRPSQEQERT